ncbi:hypothetical protein Bbelb_105720 [Branchiostoma belcheri]|nr:hypothetical protein Bbelb_105720 [Branchiostoma belcheri]
MPDSRIREFGQWIVTHEWLEVHTAVSAESKTAAFYNTLNTALDKHFPQKRTKVHNNDKPWISTVVKSLILKRQEAHRYGHRHLYKFLRNKIARLISTSKKNYYADHIEHLKKTKPAQWHKTIRHLANWSRPSPTIHVPGFEPTNTSGAAQAINSHLAAICQALPPLDYSRLPAYLPALPPPQIYPWDMYQRLQRVKVSKAPGPDLIPPKLIKEFAYELSTPLTDILNTSLREGRVPEVWRDATVIPVPKEYPADLNKIRPISLTAQFAKICEGFISTWIFSDIFPNVDIKQFGNMKRCSTTHCLIDLLNFFYEGAERKSTVGTLILTDFSKAFDRVCHTTAINKLISMGTRPSLIPWLCSFVSNRRQRVRYQDSISSWETLTCGVAQGTLLGPLVFLAMINDAKPNTNNPHWKYVDDMNLGEVRTVSTPTKLQTDLDSLDTWAETNSIRLHKPGRGYSLRCICRYHNTAVPDLSSIPRVHFYNFLKTRGFDTGECQMAFPRGDRKADTFVTIACPYRPSRARPGIGAASVRGGGPLGRISSAYFKKKLKSLPTSSDAWGGAHLRSLALGHTQQSLQQGASPLVMVCV